MTKIPHDVYRVIWWDAQDLGGAWNDAASVKYFAKQPCEVTSYGFLVDQTDAYVVLAGDFIVGKTYGRVTKIPKPWVRKIEKV